MKLNNQINFDDFKSLMAAKKLVTQFDEIINGFRKDLLKVEFCQNKNINQPQINFTANIYRVRFKCKDDNAVFYDLGFGFDKNDVWAFIGFVFFNKKTSEPLLTDIKKLLTNKYEIKKGEDINQIIAVEQLKSDYLKVDIIKKWFKERLQEVQDNDIEIDKIIN